MARGEPGEEVYTPRVQPEDLPRKITPHDEAAPVGQAFEQAFEASNRKYQADSATWASSEISKARVRAVQSLEAAKSQVPAGEDPGDFAGNFAASFARDNSQLVDSVAQTHNPVVESIVKRGLSETSDALFEHAKAWEAAQRVAYRQNSFDTNLSSQLPVVEAHPELQTQVGSTLMDQLQGIGGDPSRRLALARNMHQQLSLAAANGYTRQNPQGMYQAINDPENAPAQIKDVLSGLSDQQREAVLAKAKVQVSTGYSDNVVNTYRTAGPVAGARALTDIDRLNQPDDIKMQIRADVEKGLSQWHQEARQAHQQDIMGLEERMASGHPVPSDSALTLSLWRSGAFTAEQAGETRGRLEKAQEAQVEDTTYRDFVADAYRNGRAIDPKDDGNKKGATAVFEGLTQGVPPGSPEWINRGADIAAKTGVTPDPIVSWARAKVVAGDPASAAQGADALQRMQDANPRGNGYSLDPETKAMAKMIADQTQAGVDAQTAVENARKLATIPDGQKQRLEELYHANANAISKGAQGALTSRLKSDPQLKAGFLQSTPYIPPDMVGQFEQLRQNYFKLTNGNVNQSADLAFHDLKNVWGVSQVNGRREYMEFAPEAMNPGLTSDFLRKDMETSVTGKTTDPTKVHLIATPETFHSEGQRWALGVPDQFGAYDVVRDTRGNPLSYQLPTAQASIIANRDKAAKEGLDRLHTLQQNARDQEKDEWSTIDAEILQRQRFGNLAFK